MSKDGRVDCTSDEEGNQSEESSGQLRRPLLDDGRPSLTLDIVPFLKELEQVFVDRSKEVKLLLMEHNVPMKYWAKLHERLFRYGSIYLDEQHQQILNNHKQFGVLRSREELKEIQEHHGRAQILKDWK
jgi:hypothetical protein